MEGIRQQGTREMVLIEKITFRDEPKQFDGVFENELADNAIKSMFIEQGKDQTLWVMQMEFISEHS